MSEDLLHMRVAPAGSNPCGKQETAGGRLSTLCSLGLLYYQWGDPPCYCRLFCNLLILESAFPGFHHGLRARNSLRTFLGFGTKLEQLLATRFSDSQMWVNCCYFNIRDLINYIHIYIYMYVYTHICTYMYFYNVHSVGSTLLESPD